MGEWAVRLGRGLKKRVGEQVHEGARGNLRWERKSVRDGGVSLLCLSLFIKVCTEKASRVVGLKLRDFSGVCVRRREFLGIKIMLE